tara:strand:- start:50 stop:241 length:192 start_codon:yes stop_codon:yes gene_type:complete
MELENFLHSLRKTIREHMNEGADHLSTGGAKNFEDYQRLVGRIEGLAIVEREILDLDAKLRVN